MITFLGLYVYLGVVWILFWFGCPLVGSSLCSCTRLFSSTSFLVGNRGKLHPCYSEGGILTWELFATTFRWINKYHGVYSFGKKGTREKLDTVLWTSGWNLEVQNQEMYIWSTFLHVHVCTCVYIYTEKYKYICCVLIESYGEMKNVLLHTEECLICDEKCI